MPRRRLAPADQVSPLRVVIRATPPALAQAAGRHLSSDGVELAPDGVEPTVVVAGAAGMTFARQRQRAIDTVERYAPLPVLLISDLDEPGALRRLLATGAHGLVLVSELEGALTVAVRAVAAGQLCVTQRTRAAVVRRALTAREREILALVIMGLSNGEIARRLHLAESTVKTHLASTFSKLGVHSRAEATLLVADPQEMLSTGVLGVLPNADGDDG